MESNQPPSHIAGLIYLLPVQDVGLELAPLLVGGLILIVLFSLSALFSGSEVAIFSLGSSDRDQLASNQDRASQRVIKLLEKPRSFLVTILILNTFVNVGAAILTAIITHDMARALGWNQTVTLLGEVVMLTFVLLIVSEITPKLLATRHPMKFCQRLSMPLLFLHRLLFPISSVIAKSMLAFHNKFKPGEGRKAISGQDLKTMAEIGEAHGTIEEEERELIHSIVEFGNTSVREIMISRLDVVALHAGATVAEAIDIIRSSGHSRLPLYVEHLDNILGVVYAKDLLRYMTKHKGVGHIDWTSLARPPIFVPLRKKLDDLLSDFQDKKTHIALVVDEYGGTAGLVTLEDVLEEIVGEIRDERDESERDRFEKIEENVYRFDARIDLDELNNIAGTSLHTEDFDFETLGGLIFHLAGEIPAAGDSFVHRNLKIKVEKVNQHRIMDVLVTVKPKSELQPVDTPAPEGESEAGS